MFDLVTFGEAMPRLSPPDFKRLEQTDTLLITIGGTELNVSVGASRLGLKTTWVSKLPENPLGRMIRNKARELGVDTSHIVWDPDGRAGLYFFEFGATPRPSSVLYDRANSSFSNVTPGEIQWESILNGSKCLHITGITPAVSPSAARVTEEAFKAAQKVGCKVSMDLNYRAKLWSPEQARKTIGPLMDYVNILIASIGDTRIMLDIEAQNEEALAKTLLDRYPLDAVAVSVREGDSMWRCRWSAIAGTQRQIFSTRTYDIEIVDQLGRGDSFAAGFLYGYISANDVQKGLDYGVAFAALKHSFPGDLNWCTKEEVETLLKGPRPGVSR